MSQNEIIELEFLLSKAIVKLDLGVREINVLKLSKKIISKNIVKEKL